ncbi:MAG: alkaline phosphatase D family protein [Rhodocyclales bacterium]|nr:alkaline phosphatase D family protein [Rhodocyclales bacterium]
MAAINFRERRRLLQLAVASAASLWLPRGAWSQARFSSNPFALGVASGSPTHDSVVLWTRLLAEDRVDSGIGREAITVRWEVAHDDGFIRIVRSGQTQALAELAHSVHVEVSGLESDRWYFFRFMVGDAVSTVGRTRTFPAADASVDRLRLGYASCQRWEHGYFSAYRHMREENLDAVMFLGDYIYEYSGSRNAVRVPSGGWVLTLDDYRQRYALHKGEADLQAMHAACPWLMTWDDHEVQNDYAGQREGENGPPVANFIARRAAAYQAYYEHMPLRSSVLTQATAGLVNAASGAEMRIYNRVEFGRLASLYLLDARQYKDPQVCNSGGKAGSSSVNPAACPEWNDPRRTMLGVEQERWLHAEFSRAGKSWNVVGQQTLFGQRDLRPGPGQSFWNDGWDGYPAARKRLTDSLVGNSVANPVLLGGDVHENWVGHVKADYADAASKAVGVEFCGTSITSRSGGNAKTAERLAENPHFVFAEAERKGYGIAEFTPKQLTVALRVVDDVTRKDTSIETLARFTVAAGQSVIEKA